MSTNREVADFNRSRFRQDQRSTVGGGPPKLEAQVLVAALATYVTNERLAGQAASAYGFDVTTHGLGVRTFQRGPARRRLREG